MVSQISNSYVGYGTFNSYLMPQTGQDRLWGSEGWLPFTSFKNIYIYFLFFINLSVKVSQDNLYKLNCCVSLQNLAPVKMAEEAQSDPTDHHIHSKISRHPALTLSTHTLISPCPTLPLGNITHFRFQWLFQSGLNIQTLSKFLSSDYIPTQFGVGL